MSNAVYFLKLPGDSSMQPKLRTTDLEDKAQPWKVRYLKIGSCFPPAQMSFSNHLHQICSI